MHKKSQITLFIILGIVIVAAAVLTLYIYNEETIVTELRKIPIIYTKIRPINTYIQNCVDKVGYEGLKKIGLQGGYTDIPAYIRYQDTAYWYLEEKNIQPLLNETRTRLISYVNKNLRQCLDFSQYEQEGFSFVYGNISSDVVMGAEDVTLQVTFPIQIKYQDVEHQYKDFIERYDIRFRKIWELASKYENMFFNPNFDHKKPLEGVDPGEFIVSVEPPLDESILVYKIEDKRRYIFGKNDYTFRFAFKHGASTLTRTVSLQQNCNTIPNYRPQIIYSLDRDAQLFIRPMTTFEIPGSKCDISIQQSYEDMAYTDYQWFQYNDQQFGFSFPLMGVIPRKLTQPVYNIEPTGTKASQSMRLKLYWDEDYNPMKGPVGILAKHGDEPWRPIDTNPVYSERYSWTEIQGFTKFTLLDCGQQTPIRSETKSTAKPKWPCYIVSIVGVGSYKGNKDCISFTPSCDGPVYVKKTANRGKGSCMLMPENIMDEVQSSFSRFSEGAANVAEGINGSRSLLADYNSGELISEGINDKEDFIELLNTFISEHSEIFLGLGADCNPDSSEQCCSQFNGAWYAYTNLENNLVSYLCSNISCSSNEDCNGIFSFCSSQGCVKPCSSAADCSGIRQCVEGGCRTPTWSSCTGVNCNYMSNSDYDTGDTTNTGEQNQDNNFSELLGNYLDTQAQIFESGGDLSQEELVSLFGNFLSSNPELLQDSTDAINIFNSYLDGHPELFENVIDEEELREQPDFFSSLRDTVSPLISLFSMFQGSQVMWLQGGHTYKVCAKIKDCEQGWGPWNCKKCSITCTAYYK